MKKYLLLVFVLLFASFVVADCSRYSIHWLKHAKPIQADGHIVEVIEASTNGGYCTFAYDDQEYTLNKGRTLELEDFDMRLSEAIAVYGPGWKYSEAQEECTLEVNGHNFTLEVDQTYTTSGEEITLVSVSPNGDYCGVKVGESTIWVPIGQQKKITTVLVKVLDAVKTGRELISRSNIYDTCELEFIPKGCNPDKNLDTNLPDLIVEDIDWSPNPGVVGDTLDLVSITIKNIGDEIFIANPYITVEIYREGDTTNSWFCKRTSRIGLFIEPGKEQTVAIPHTEYHGWIKPPYITPKPRLAGYFTLDGASLLFTTHFQNCSKFELGEDVYKQFIEEDDYRIKVTINDIPHMVESEYDNNDLVEDMLVSDISQPVTDCLDSSKLVSGSCIPKEKVKCTDTDPDLYEVEPYTIFGNNYYVKGKTCMGDLCKSDETILEDCIGCTPKLIEYYCSDGTNTIMRMKVDCPDGTEIKEGYCLNITTETTKEDEDTDDQNEETEEEVQDSEVTTEEQTDELTAEPEQESSIEEDSLTDKEITSTEKKPEDEKESKGIIAKIVNWFKRLFG